MDTSSSQDQLLRVLPASEGSSPELWNSGFIYYYLYRFVALIHLQRMNSGSPQCSLEVGLIRAAKSSLLIPFAVSGMLCPHLESPH